jgi:hypothetical protein
LCGALVEDVRSVHAGRENMAMAETMNGAIARLAGRRRIGEAPPENGRMNAAQANLERAERNGADETTLAILNDQLDQAVQDSRRAWQEREQAPVGSFDGCSRRSRRKTWPTRSRQRRSRSPSAGSRSVRSRL